MRVLVVTHDYPPPIAGGYEAMAADVCNGFLARGHEVEVLTSNRQSVPMPQSDAPTVTRALRTYYANGECIYPTLRDAIEIERHNLSTLDRVLSTYQPDVVSFWHMGAMSLNLIGAAAERGYALVFVVGDDWMVYGAWADGWHRRFLPDFHPGRARVVRHITGIPTELPNIPRLGTVCFISEYTRSRAAAHYGVATLGTVVPPGLVTQFYDNRNPTFSWNDQLLWVGRVLPSKGILTALRAMAELPRDVNLRVLGLDDVQFSPSVHREIDQLGLRGRVIWAQAKRSDLPGEYRRACATLFTSEIEHESFGLVALEAMASGSVVVSTAVGGNAELCRDSVNCLTFAPGDAHALARAITRLRDDAALCRVLGAAALATADRYTIERQVTALEGAFEAEIQARSDT